MAERSPKKVENTVGKGEIALEKRAISPFPAEFQKSCDVKTRAYLENG